MALDGGPCAFGLEATGIALLDQPRLLRPGAVTRGQIEALIGPLFEAQADAKRSPGRLTRHYAPNLPLRLNVTEPRRSEVWLGFGKLGGGGGGRGPAGGRPAGGGPREG